MLNNTGILTIDLAAICANWRYLSSLSGSTCGAVVKANAYGLGAAEVAASLFEVGCRLFYVVTLAEAKELRQCLPGANIILLGGLFQADPAECIRYQVVPVLFSREQVGQWIRFSSDNPNTLRPVIKVDTGMHRYGVDAVEFVEWLQSDVNVLAQINPVAVMSHLACSEQTAHPLNQLQLERFLQVKSVVHKLDPTVLFSLANSSGIFLGVDFHFDWLRPGAALYGINPLLGAVNPMSKVVSVQLPVAQIKPLVAGESVGYGATFSATESMVIAIVFGGYADGLLRQLGDRASVVYQNKSVPVIGRLSMDSMVLDVSSVHQEIAVGDLVEVFPDVSSLDDCAGLAGSIGYELLTRLGRRYQRRYLPYFHNV